ncbi:D-alanyl-D-alanine carboxypeptidase [Streptomyces longisporoflavus]|uniref:D-alanyl-D-alanine carboxypeptidase n=1 Tax=Streptomyces longisporoflavus TaxID=28044 RepID=A0ABW7QYQ0_9ACTN
MGPTVFWRNGNASGMAYEEASVAGETPDRSKQRKSSGNPTGSEPSVPAQAPEERDPRLAVAREVPAAREDRATAVFSTKAVKDAAAADSGSSGTSGASGASAEGAKGAGSEPKGAENGDARLRAAVAAWVATADEETPEDAEKAPESGAADEDASAGAGAGAGGGEGSSGDSDSGADSETGADDVAESAGGSSAGPEGGKGSSGGADSDADSETGAAGSDSDSETGSDSDTGADDATDSPGGASDGPVGAKGSSGDAGDAGATEGAASEPVDGEGPAEKSDSGEADAGDEAADAADSGADEPAKAEGPADEAADAVSGEAAAADAAAATDGPAGDADAADDEPADAENSADAADSVEDAVPGSSDKPAVGKTPSWATGAADKAPGAKPADSKPADSKTGADKAGTAKAGGKDAEGEPPATGVDQATAVFKLPPKGKAVDQPTTMLKVGDHKAGTGKKSEPGDPADKADDKADDKAEAKPAAKPGAKPEADAERTSKFVALKPLDDASSSRTLPPAAPATKASTPAKAPTPESAPTPGTGNAGPERTTQQPLPPRPPLDLLAELTNTPPPPETPVRTVVRRVKVWTPLVLLLLIVFAVVQAVRPLPTPTLTLTAKETVSFEGEKPSMPWPGEGQAAMDVNGIGTFGTSGDQKPVPIASIAKVMTVYLVLRDHPLKPGNNGPDIPVDAAAEKHYETGKAENESVVKVSEGQKIKQYEALQAVMLPSANNIAKLLARWDTKSDSEDEFVAKMNKTAKELGMKNTHYTDPSGLDKTTVSTAEDLVKLGRAAMEDPVFNEISRQPSYKDLNGDKQNNFFGLVPTVAIGIKTGTTTAAGGNILFAAEQKVGGETRTIIGAALGQYGNNGTANIDEVTGVTRKLIEAGQGALKAKTIVKKGDVVGEVDDGLGGTTPVVATKDVSAAGWSGLTVKLKLGDKAGQSVPHSAKAGTKVGVLSVGDGKDGAVEVPVALQKDLAEPSFGAKLTRVG